MPRAQLTQRAQEFAAAAYQVHVASHRLHNDAGDLRAVQSEGFMQLLAIVVVEHHRVARHVGGHSGRARVTGCQRARARLHQQAVGVAVIAAFEFYDPVPSGGAARKPYRAHRSLGAGRHQTQLFDRRHQTHDALGEFDLGLGRSAEREAARRGRLNRLDDRRVGMTYDHRAPRANQVDVAPAVLIPQQRTLGPRDERRGTPDRPEGPDRGIHPARDAALGTLEELFVSVHQGSGRWEKGAEYLDSAGKEPSFGRTSYDDVVGMLANSPQDLES